MPSRFPTDPTASPLSEEAVTERPLRLPDDLWGALEQMARKLGVTPDHLIAGAAKEYLSRRAGSIDGADEPPGSSTKPLGSPSTPTADGDVVLLPPPGHTQFQGTRAPISTARPPPVAAAPRVFLTCVEPDQRWLEALKRHLAPVAQSGYFEVWDPTQILAGSDPETEIMGALLGASIAVPLISAHFGASARICERVLPRMLRDVAERGLRVMPLLVSPTDFHESPLRDFQPFNPPGDELTVLRPFQREALLANVAQTLRAVLGSR
jgi:hypothetical protein